MTIEENLSLAVKRGRQRGFRLGLNKNRRAEFRQLLALLELGLENRLECPVKLLSGGQRQALTLLMATMGNPKILLLDEYTAALDPKTAMQIIKITDRIVTKDQLTVLMVTHDLKQALAMGNRTIMMVHGEIILDLELDYDSPVAENCGECRRCLTSCPTGAIERPHWVNASKCISYQTIENKGEIAPDIALNLRNNVYGCDICQLVCPWNRVAQPHDTPEFMPSDEFLSLDLKKLLEMDEEGFREVFRHSAVKRAKFSGLKRNATAISKTRYK